MQSQYNSLGLKIAVQDGPDDGQSVIHIHVHLLPRNDHELERSSKIYNRLEELLPRADHNPPLQKWDVPKNNTRRDRT